MVSILEKLLGRFRSREEPILEEEEIEEALETNWTVDGLGSLSKVKNERREKDEL